MFKVFTIFICLIGVIYGDNERNIIQSNGLNSPIYGPFYCQARCLANCIETNLANSLEECAKYCPPFDNAMPCQPDNAECWRTCGIPATPGNKPPPPSVNFVMAQYASTGDDRVQDPFTIELTWGPAPSASLYIIEMYPLNRAPRPGENNFFRALTSFPTYVVRKEDECTIYDVRVMPVNANGVGAPQYTRIEAPRPTMSNADFNIRSIQRDRSNTNFVVVSIAYAIPSTWPVSDVDLNGLRVKAMDCRGLPSQNTNTSDNVWYPYYDAMIQKAPMGMIRLAFLNEVVQADCVLQMRVSALTTRCNTTTYFDSNGSASQDSTVGVDFRINCQTAEGYACGDTAPPVDVNVPSDPSLVPPQPPVPSFVMPNNTGPVPAVVPDGPVSQMANGPRGINAADLQPLLLQYLAINAQYQTPMSCEVDIDVQPLGPSHVVPSLLDIAVYWREQDLMPQQRAPVYFLVRYGPTVRNLVQDSRQPRLIIPGYENLVRAGRPGMQAPSMQINYNDGDRSVVIMGVPRNGLLSVQVCAIYDPNVEPTLMWDAIPSQYIDVLAMNLPPVQPDRPINPNPSFIQDQVSSVPSGSERQGPQRGQPNMNPSAGQGNPIGPDGSVTWLTPLATDESPLHLSDQHRFAPEDSTDMDNSLEDSMPVVVQVGFMDGNSGSKFWPMMAGGVFAALLFAVVAFLGVMCLWSKGTDKKEKKIRSYPIIPIATITQTVQEQAEGKEKELEKVALP